MCWWKRARSRVNDVQKAMSAALHTATTALKKGARSVGRHGISTALFLFPGRYALRAVVAVVTPTHAPPPLRNFFFTFAACTARCGIFRAEGWLLCDPPVCIEVAFFGVGLEPWP